MKHVEDNEAQRHIENLRAVLAGPAVQAPPRGQKPVGDEAPGAETHASHRARNGALGGASALGLLLLGKLKFLGLLAGVLKLKTFASMILSIGFYATQWGLPFAAGFVLLIFVHEAGHAIALRREGIAAGAPVFIPFVGAFIAMREMPRNAYVEAKVGIAGPVLGSLAAWAVLAIGLGSQNRMLVNLGHAGILINLFNLIPVSPLDGGRVAGAFSRGAWLAGYAIGAVMVFVTRSPVLVIVLLVGLYTMRERWRHPIPGYHDIPSANRRAMGLAYAALVIALALTLPIGLTIHPDVGI